MGRGLNNRIGVRIGLVAVTGLVGGAAGASDAVAAWDGDAAGATFTKADTMPAGIQPTTSISGRNVTVDWTPSTFSGGSPVGGYALQRYDTGGDPHPVVSSCSGTIPDVTCTAVNVPPGSWRYAVTPKHGDHWVGAESSQSATQVVPAPSYTLSGWSSVTELPASVDGDLAAFETGATVTYRLDDPDTGQLLSASTTPSTIGNDGAAGNSVTIPSGVSNGPHTIWAIGSGGDRASVPITVTTCSSPGSQTVYANADTYLLEDHPDDTNHGGENEIKVKSKPGANRRGLVGFSLPSIPSGCAITAATLELYETVADGSRTIVARRVTGSWSEATSWNTQPGTSSVGEASNTAAVGDRSWSVKRIVKDMYAQGSYGFELRDSAEDDAGDYEQKYHAREQTPDSQDPRLTVTFGADSDAKLTLSSSSTLTSLPASLNGNLTQWPNGSTLTYRLDDPTTGTLLSATTTPTTIGTNGEAAVSVTVPSGTANGAHQIYAIGSGGDVASVDITVSLPSITTAAWGLSDVSSGTPIDLSDATAFDDNRLFPGDSPFAAANFANSFQPDRFYQWDYNAPLPAGQAVSNAAFDFRFQSNAGSEVACFYFDVIRGGSTIGTYGSTTPGSAGSQWCTDGTEKLVSTTLPVVTTTDIANGLSIKVYGYESNNKPIKVDQATISGTAGGAAFTLYEVTGNDQADATAETFPWSLGLQDGVFFKNASNYGSSFTATKYNQVTFPTGYLPTSASLETVNFVHRWQADNGSTVCYYLEVLSGGSSLGTVPSSPGDLSCSVGNSSWVADTIPLPMVDTKAKLNGLVVRMIYRTSAGGGTKAREDFTGLSVTYD